MSKRRANELAEQVYGDIKAEIFDFRLLPGDRFTETELAERYGVSRTPIRDALYRLKRDGYLDVAFRSGWSVRPFDFSRFDELYDLRTVLETTAIERLCRSPAPLDLADLTRIWSVPPEQWVTDARRLMELDEDFHAALVDRAGNREISLVYGQIAEKIRIVRRLGYLHQHRQDATYIEHNEILQLLARRKEAETLMVLRAHITHAKQEVHKITLHMLYEARNTGTAPQVAVAS